MSRAAATVPAALFVAALAVRAAAATGVDFPPTEVSAYYVGVGRNLLEGDGLTSDAVWSYATPPLVVPKPAFDLWLPMATFVALPAMIVLGPTLWAAQLAHAVLGALLAPLAWWLGRDAARRAGLPAARAVSVALTSGLLVAVLGPLVVASMGPDSTTPFAVFAVAAAVVAPTALGGRDRAPSGRAGVALGLLLGLAYLSRQEALFLGFVVLIAGLRRGWRVGLLTIVPIVLGGAAVTLPWLARNALTFGTLFPGQAIENALLVRPTDIFAWTDRPTVARYLAQGPSAIAGNVAAAARHNVVDVLLISALPVGGVGVLALAAFRRSPALRLESPLGLLALAGFLTLAALTFAFPVATLSGTWLHASGPTLVALAALAALGGDAAVARIARLRAWSRQNAWLAPVALLAVALPIALLSVSLVTRQSQEEGVRARAAAERLAAAGPGAVALSDHPIWLAEAGRRPALALPDESPRSLHDLAQRFGARIVVIFDSRGPYPAALDAGAPCFSPLDAGAAPARLYAVDIDGCTP